MSTVDLGSLSFVTTPDVNGNLIIYSNGGVITFSAAATGSRPAAGNAGAVFIDTSLFQLEYDNGTSWNNVGVGSVTAGAGITTSGSTGAITISNSGVTSATATANQITVSSATGAVTFGIAANPIIPGTADVTIPVGTVAQRPATPTDGMIRYNSDDDILEGYSSPYNITTQPMAFQRTIIYHKRRTWVDEFMGGSVASKGISTYGNMGWSITKSSGTPANTIITSIADHPGILSVGTGGSNGNNVRIHLASLPNTNLILATQVQHFTFLIRIPTTSNVVIRFGLGQDLTTTTSAGTFGTDGVFFQYNSSVGTSLQFITRSGGTSSAAVDTLTVAANTWYMCEAFYDGTNWIPVVNGTTYTSQTTNISTHAMNIGLTINNLSSSSRHVQFDYFSMMTVELGTRYP